MKTGMFLLLLMGTISSSLAEGTWPCQESAKKLCAGVEPGGGRILECLKAHEAELPADCKGTLAHRAERKEHRKEMHGACLEDIKSKCKDVPPGEGRIIQCLKDQEASLSAGCKAEISKAKAMKEERKNAPQGH